MKWLFVLVVLAGCGNDPLPPRSPCAAALSNFYSHGCVVYTESLGQPLNFSEALEKCAQWIDLCRDLLDCLRRVPSGIDCGDCNGDLFECRKRVDTLGYL